MNAEYLNTYFKIPGHRAEDLPAEFAIVTAFNPEGKGQSIETNLALDSDLAAQIQKRSLQSWRVIGGSRDFAHTEPGYAIKVDLAVGIEIGVQFRQEAIFWIEGGNLHLVDCASHQQTLMGEWKLRLLQTP